MIRIRRGTYRPQPSRLIEIPKEDGSTRPLAISCVEDKLVQVAASRILESIYEPLFLPCSYGFRPGMSCHGDLKSLVQATYKAYDGAVVEIDLRKYFNSIPHQQLFEILDKKISDKHFLQLLRVLTKAEVVNPKGEIFATESGCPQGSCLSPVLSNIYLHVVIDEWFAVISNTHLKGWTKEIRYADDMVFVFQYASQASRFYKVLNKRLHKFGISLHTEKSQILPSGTKVAERSAANKKRMGVFKFLGFTCYWGKSRNGRFWRLKLKSRADRLRIKLKNLRKFLRDNLNTTNVLGMLKQITRVVQGWVNYHAVSDNQQVVSAFLDKCRKIIYKGSVVAEANDASLGTKSLCFSIKLSSPGSSKWYRCSQHRRGRKPIIKSGAECGNSACSVLRRSLPERSGRFTHLTSSIFAVPSNPSTLPSVHPPTKK